jgi:hypothetical protein
VKRTTRGRTAAAVGVAVLAATLAGVASAMHFSPWGTPTNAEAVPGTSSELNTAFNDGCPIQSPNGLSLYIASNRPGGLGGQDIWVAHRESKDGPWGAPQNLGEPVNSAANDFCPTPLRGRLLLFVSERVVPGSCGSGDIYSTRLTAKGGWAEPQNLGCQVNSAAGEAGPSLVKTDNGELLYFSSARAGGFSAEAPGAASGDSDIYASFRDDGEETFGPAELVPGLNTASDDFRPNVRKDGVEIVFDSNRPGTLGGQDIWSSTLREDGRGWSTPVDLTTVNSSANETRASLSWDGKTLTFGSNRPGTEGMADVYFSTRDKVKRDKS